MRGKTAIVTGGARGIGYGIATGLARKKVNVVLADADGPAARKSAAELARKYRIRALGLTCDITNRKQVQSAVRQTVKRFGGIDILVNNAGICPFVHIMDMSPEMYLKTIDVDLNGAFHCTQLAAQEMIKRKKGGRIIFITSLAANVTGAAQVDYAAAKGGLHMLMKGFAIALGPHGITCNAVAPGMIYTDLTKFHWDKPENIEALKRRVPVGRIGMPEDIGHVVAFLASEEAGYVNGIGIIVDGGHQAVCA